MNRKVKKTFAVNKQQMHLGSRPVIAKLHDTGAEYDCSEIEIIKDNQVVAKIKFDSETMLKMKRGLSAKVWVETECDINLINPKKVP